MLRSIGKQSGKCVESVPKMKGKALRTVADYDISGLRQR